MTLAQAALAYYDGGWTVFPLKPGAKQPGVRWSDFVTKRPTRAQVIAWWKAEPSSNIALLTGVVDGCRRPLVVVDVDLKGGGDINDQRLLVAGGPRTWTQSGGRHFFYAHPGGVRVKSCARPTASMPGCDLRADGGYVVAAPSVGEKGEYVAEIDLLTAPTLPGWGTVANLFVGTTQVGGAAAPGGSSPPPGSTDNNWIARALQHVDVGGQRQAITRLAGYFAKKTLPVDVAKLTILNAVRKWPHDEARGKWTGAEVDACVSSIYAKEGPLPGQADAETGLKCYSFGDYMGTFEGRGVEWLVEGWLPAGAVGLVVAPPQTYKTWLLLDLALSVAMGEPFLGRYPVHGPGPVLYVQAEDPAGVVAERLGHLVEFKAHGWRDQLSPITAADLDVPRPPLFMSLGEGLSLRPEGRNNLRAAVEEIRPVLVILDPLYAFAGATQGFYQEVPNYIAFLKHLRAKYGTAFLIAHHTKKQSKEFGDAGREQTWGSNLMTAASEVDWQIRRVTQAQPIITVARHFKAAGTRDRVPFRVEIETESGVQPLLVTELTMEELAEAVEGRQEEVAEQRSEGRKKGSAKNAAGFQELCSNVLAALKAGQTKTAVIATVLGSSSAAVKRALSQLAQDGKVLKEGRGPKSSWVPTLIDPKEVS